MLIGPTGWVRRRIRAGRVFAAHRAFWLARGRFAGATVRWVFAHAAWVLPVRRVEMTPHLIAFHHPRPSFPLHVLIVPRKGIAGLMAITGGDESFLADIMDLAAGLAPASLGGNDPVALVINAGTSQDVGQLHAHLIAGPAVPRYACPPHTKPVHGPSPGRVFIELHPAPLHATHVVLRPTSDRSGGCGFFAMNTPLASDLVVALQHLVGSIDPPLPGWSLIAGTAAGSLDVSCLHMIAGPAAGADGPPST